SPHDSAARFRDLGVDVFLGEGRFAGPDAVEVGGQTLRFARALIATGSRAAAPPVPGLAEGGFLTNETVFALTELPRSLAVVGAGPVGCELAQAFARFGAKVHLLDVEPRPLPREEPEASALVERALVRDGVELVLGVKLQAAERRPEGKVLRLDAGEVGGDEVLVAAGRKPNGDGLNLEAAG